MKRIGISAELERRIRAYPRNTPVSAIEITDELVRLLDDKPEVKAPGIPYAQIVTALREGLGDRLAVPEKPNVSWIVRQVNRVKELGLAYDDLRELGRGAASIHRGSVEMEYLLRQAVRVLADVRAKAGAVATAGRVYTGRDEE